jgi:glycosyltransferase involved in cell wall biosynthesis
MKVLYSTQSVVEFDGQHYFSNPVQAAYRRYLTLGEEITVFSYLKVVKQPKSTKVDDGAVKFFFAKKINTFTAILRHDSEWNDKQAEKLVKESDVCVCHVPCGHSYQVIKYAKKFNKPYLIVVCGCPWDALWNYDWRGKLLAPQAYFTLKSIVRDAPYSIYVTNEFLQKRYPTKGKSIGCSNVNISTGIEGVLEQRLDNIEKRMKDGRTLRIGTAAAIDVPYKGQEYVIRALAQLKKYGIRYEYHLIGLGSDERLRGITEKEGVSDRVFFHGALPHSEVLAFMDDMDIYVQPSKQEGLPRATIEAMSRGCLCLGSRVAGIPELLEEGYLFSKGSINEINAILRKVNKQSLLQQAKRNFNEAKCYDRDLLNERRTTFIGEFKNSYTK